MAEVDVAARGGTGKGPGRLLLVGNPNVGKSVFFDLLTGRYVVVSNYPGTTVEVSRGTGRAAGRTFEVIDTPGANSLSPNSEDERVARDIVLEPGDGVVLQVADAKNLRRALLLTAQLAELDAPVVLALNMWDEAQDRGVEIDVEALSGALGVPVVPTVATERRGVHRLFAAVGEARGPTFLPRYGPAIEEAVGEVASMLPPDTRGRRGLALMLLTEPPSGERPLAAAAWPGVAEGVERVRSRLAGRLRERLALVVQRRRAAEADRLVATVMKRAARGTPGPGRTLGRALARLSTHPVGGPVLLAFVLWIMYEVVGVFGAGTCVDFLEGRVFGKATAATGEYGGWVNGPASRALGGVIGRGNLVYAFLFDPTAGLISTGLTYSLAIVLPIVTLFFLLFSLMEDSGYLPRLSFLADRAFKQAGLSGKAVLPMVLGLGCGTMAAMTTRILETRRQRLIAVFLLTLAVPCSAQLGVIAAILSDISASGTLIYVGVLAIVLFVVGKVAAWVIPGDAPDLLLEVPPFRWPQARNVALKTWHRVLWFMREAVPLFLLGTVCLFVADRTGLLALVERWVSPVVSGMLGLPGETARGFIMGFLRRDYGTVIIFEQFRSGLVDAEQVLVALVVIMLFVPCLAQFLVCVKELGWRRAAAVGGAVFAIALLVGVALRAFLAVTGITVGAS